MSAAALRQTASDVTALLVSLGLHACVLLLPLAAHLWSRVHPSAPQPELPNSVAMVGNSIEVDVPTPELAAAPPPAPDAETEASQADSSSAAEMPPRAAAKTAEAAEPQLAHTRPRPKATVARRAPKPRAGAVGTPARAGPPSAPSPVSDAPASGAPKAGTFGQEGLAPGVRRLGYAFTRAIPAATPSDSAWRELPPGRVGTIHIELQIDENNRLGALGRWQARPGEPPPPPVLERLVERTLLLLRAGQFALSGSNQAGSERLTIEVTLRDEAPEGEGEGVVVQKKFEGATPGHPGIAYFRYGSGRIVESKVTIAKSGR